MDSENRYEKSCGAVVCRRAEGKIEFLLLFQHRSKTWSFPKGHVQKFESERQTALREIKEEIGLDAQFIDGFRESLTYPVEENGKKEVVLFLVLTDSDISLQEEEIQQYVWTDKHTAAKLLTRKEYIDILDKAEKTVL